MSQLRQLKLCRFFLHGYVNFMDFDDMPTNGKHCRKCKDKLGILNILLMLATIALFVTMIPSERGLAVGFIVALIIHGSIHQYIMQSVRAIHGSVGT